MAETRPLRRIKLTRLFPEGINPDNPDDMMRLTRAIQEKAAKDPDKYGGYLIDSISDDGQYAIIAPMAMPTDDKTLQKLVTQGEARAEEIDVADSIGEARQKQTVDRIELNYASSTDPTIIHEPGKTWKVIDFIPRTSVKCAVMLQLMDERTISVRQQFADALGIARYPWQIRITPTAEGGWKIRIRSTTLTYRPSRHDAKLQETVESVGAPGWFFKGDADNGVITVYPGIPPTFPMSIPMPEALWSRPDGRYSHFGMKLPDRGRETGDDMCIDWKNSPFVLVCGEQGGGKSVVINSLIYGRIISGAEIYVGNVRGKGYADYTWLIPYLAEHGRGFDGLESTAAMLLYIEDQIEVRGKLVTEHGVTNWWELPQNVKDEYPQIFLAMDEISQLDVIDRTPTGVDKKSPDAVRKQYRNDLKFSIRESLTRIPQVGRYAGVTAIYSAQSAKEQAGITTLMRDNLGSKIIVGERVPEPTRTSVLKDPKHAPYVPGYIIEQKLGKGTGIAELVGQEACVYKGYYEEIPGRKTWVGILSERAQQFRDGSTDGQQGVLSRKFINSYIEYAFRIDESQNAAVEDIEPVKLVDASGQTIDATDMAAAIGL